GGWKKLVPPTGDRFSPLPSARPVSIALQHETPELAARFDTGYNRSQSVMTRQDWRSMTEKAELLADDLKHLVHPLHNRSAQATGHVWTRAHGSILVDADGKEYLDGLAGLWNVIAGHGRRE